MQKFALFLDGNLEDNLPNEVLAFVVHAGLVTHARTNDTALAGIENHLVGARRGAVVEGDVTRGIIDLGDRKILDRAELNFLLAGNDALDVDEALVGLVRTDLAGVIPLCVGEHLVLPLGEVFAAEDEIFPEGIEQFGHFGCEIFVDAVLLEKLCKLRSVEKRFFHIADCLFGE